MRPADFHLLAGAGNGRAVTERGKELLRCLWCAGGFGCHHFAPFFRSSTVLKAVRRNSFRLRSTVLSMALVLSAVYVLALAVGVKGMGGGGVA